MPDLTGLPALERIVEDLPSQTRAYVIAEVPDHAGPAPADFRGDRRRSLVGGQRSRARTEPTAQRSPGAELAGWARLRLVRRRGGRVAGGAAAICAASAIGRVQRSTILGYWRVDQEAWLARYAPVGAELEQVYARAVAAGHTSDEALALYDDAVEAAGL